LSSSSNITRRGTPDTPTEIINRLNEISFNAAIIGEMQAIALVQRLIEEDHLMLNSEAARLKNMKMHAISAEDQVRALGASSKLNFPRSGTGH
jgi:NTE family protein